MKVKTYFPVPDQDTPPGGPIALGRIIIDPSDPATSLNRTSTLPIDESLIGKTYKVGFSATRGQIKEGKVSVTAEILQISGFGGGAGAHYNNNIEDTYTVKRVDTMTFEPDNTPGNEYVDKSMQAPGVKKFLEMTRYKKPVYMITGLKIARGASFSSSTTKGHGGNAKLGFDGTAVSVPVKVGVEGDTSSTKTETDSFEESSDFVFAFRIRKVKVTHKKKATTYTDSAFNEGALFGVGEGGEDGSAERQFEVSGLVEQDATAAEFEDMDMAMMIDEDEEDGDFVLPAGHE